jgi:CubicO group peptidase (beta-lactamase class C family)
MKIKSLALALFAAASLTACGDGRQKDFTSLPPEFGATRIIGSDDVPAEWMAGPVDRLFDRTAKVDLGETRALLIFYKGKLVAERYGPGFGPESRMQSWSVAKTITGLLVGIMVADGRLALDDPVPLSAWKQTGDPRGRITLRQLLTMSSGLAHREADMSPERNDALAMLVGAGAQDMASYAAAQPIAALPGRRFVYSTATTALLAEIITARLTASPDPVTRREAMRRFLLERFVRPLGLTGFVPEFDPRGTLVGGVMMHMTAMDYARIGELMRTGGRVNGREVVPEQWIRFMLEPSRSNPSYGGHVWLNRGTASPLFPGRAPDSLFGALGHQGQYVLVSPAQQLTIVRLGVSGDAEREPLRAAMLELIRLFP